MKEFKMRLSHSPKINYMDVSASLPPEFLPNQHKENVKFVKAEIDFSFYWEEKVKIALRYLVVFLEILI